MPPAEVLASAPLKVRHGEAKVQGLASLPLPETQVWDKVLVADADAVQKSMAADASNMLRIFMGISSLEFE
jgi:hypothetical protein